MIVYLSKQFCFQLLKKTKNTKNWKVMKKPKKITLATTTKAGTGTGNIVGLQDNENRVRYSDGELKEFESIILEKINLAKGLYNDLKKTALEVGESIGEKRITNAFQNETGSELQQENMYLAERQEKLITNLENALVRIKNKSYGICCITGQLISKERLRAVPHTTKTCEVKQQQETPVIKMVKSEKFEPMMAY